MKKAIRFFLILSSITLACGGRIHAAAKSLQEAITSNLWSWEYREDGKDKAEPIRFYRDGTAKNLKFFTARWEIESPHSLVLNMRGMKASLTFNEDFSRYEGTDFHGKIKVWGVPGEGVDPDYTPANPTKPSNPVKSEVAASAPPKPQQTSIEVLSGQAPNALEWALAPLNRKAPPDIRQNLTFLREDLLDEAVKKPAATVEAYKLGQQLCNMLIGTLDERDKMLVRAGYTAAQSKVNMGEITNQALEARRSAAAPSGWRTSGAMAWPTYQREKDQREELRKARQNAAALERQRPVLEWADRSAQIRRMADLLYAQYRDAARQPASNGLRGAEESPPHPDETPLESRLSGTRWSFPINQKPKDERWIEFGKNGKLLAGWIDAAKGTPGAQESGSRSWKVISPSRVEFEPFTSHDWIFVVDFDPALEKGRIIEGEFKGQTIERSE